MQALYLSREEAQDKRDSRRLEQCDTDITLSCQIDFHCRKTLFDYSIILPNFSESLQLFYNIMVIGDFGKFRLSCLSRSGTRGLWLYIMI
jgi:hypothetical protein